MRHHVAIAALAILGFGCTTSSPTDAPTTSPTSATSATAASSPAVTSSQQVTPSPHVTSRPLPQGGEPVVLDPAEFVAVVDHAYWPMFTGSHWVYRETGPGGGEDQVDITILADAKVIFGITATVVHDVVSHNGAVVEDTLDWYAQDVAGNLWYLGEDTKEYQNGGVVSTAGSWEAGVNGAQAGIMLPGEPQVGMTYRQEYFAGQAEDAGEILSLTEHAEVPFGSFTDVLMTKDFSQLQANVVEHKFYARGIGVVLVVLASGGSSREELLTFEPGLRPGD